MTRRALIALSLLAACAPVSDAIDGDCGGEKCDEASAAIPKAACDGKITDRSGRGLKGRIAGRLNDPLSKHVLRPGAACPTTFAEVMSKLAANDKKSCQDTTARVVSERSQARGEGDSYRVMVTRPCDGRGSHELVLSLFGIAPDDDELPDDVEIVALDPSRGVYNFYTVEDGKWSFFGDSTEMLAGPGDGEVRRCAACHPGGGLVMKELESPWLHWEGHQDTPGADAFVRKHTALLGKKRDGINMESLVRAGNGVWVPRRVEHLKKSGTVKELLRPLFCTMEINLDNGAEFASPVDNTAGGTEIEDVPSELLSDLTFREIDVNPADYRSLVAAADQRVVGAGNRRLKTGDGKDVTDTVFDFVFPETSAIDKATIDQLIETRIIDDEFRKDVLMVDFTRPVFSDDRCALLDFAPELEAKDRTAAKIRAGFLEELGAPRAGTPAAQLKQNLEEAASDHDKPLGIFVNACRDRGKRDFMEDALKIASLRRKQARELPIMEFPESMPVDDLEVAAGTRFDPKSCELRTTFTTP